MLRVKTTKEAHGVGKGCDAILRDDLVEVILLPLGQSTYGQFVLGITC
jgi:hypothetical protein